LFDYAPLLGILPGDRRKIIDVSSRSPENILKMLDQITGRTDTVVLFNGDVWRYVDAEKEIFNYSKLQDKNVFLQTIGYTNNKITNRHWKISFPLFYWQVHKLTEQFVAKSNSLKYGFSCLNNNTNIHRTLLGYNLYKHNLLNDIIFSQNIVASKGSYAIDRVSEDAKILNLVNFEEYKKLLPIRYNEDLSPLLDFSLDHNSIKSDAFTHAYCNIVTESDCEEYPYSRNINLPVVTEKSYKPFRAGQIPIMLVARGHIVYLKSLGFEMMEDLLPVGFDQMNTPQKINAIVTIASKGNEFIKDFYFSHLREIQHNYELINSNKVEELILQNITNIL
jgi:hypothetical protein